MRNLIIIWIGLISFLTYSCIDESEDPEVSGSNKGGFTLTYVVTNTSVNTYATVKPEAGEELINTLHLLFFESSSNGSGKFIEMVDLSPEPGDPLSSSGIIKVDFPASSKLDNSTAYNVLAVANVENYFYQYQDIEDWLDHLEGKTENDAIQNYSFAAITGTEYDLPLDYENSKIEQGNLLMNARATKSADSEMLSLEFVRDVVRFDLVNAADGYKMVTASIWNAFTKTSIWESTFNDFTLPRTERFYGIRATGGNGTETNQIKGGLYAFENYVSNPERNDRLTTCLIIGIVKNGETDPTYYRVNINADNMGQQLKRNNVYKLTINDVLGKGAPSEKDAYTDGEFLLDFKINEWGVDDHGNIQYDGENILALPTTVIVFTPMAETRQYNIFTLGEGTLEISKRDLPAGITAELNGKVLTVSAEASEYTKQGYIEVRFGNLKATITISQTGQRDPVLKLSSYELPSFANVSGLQQSVTVTSSDTWTATLYNSNALFSFTPQGEVDTQTGISGDNLAIYTIGTNSSQRDQYAFIVVSLDSDPEITRTIVLSQKGAGGISVLPELSNIVFDPNGNILEGYTNAFVVETIDGEWEVILSGLHATSFDIERATNAPTDFTIWASPNTKGIELTATARVRLKTSTSVYKEIRITQACHNIKLSPETVPAIETAGGSTEAITVTSTSASSSNTWTATLFTENGNATFEDGSTQLIGKPFGSSFKVVFPKNLDPKNQPKAYVTVSVSGTEVTKSMTVVQRLFDIQTLRVYSNGDFYGQIINPNNDYYKHRIKQFGDNMRNASYFGPDGVVMTANPAFNFYQKHSITISATMDVDIFLICSYAPTEQNTQHIRNWLHGDSKRVLLFWYDTAESKDRSVFSLLGYSGVTRDFAYMKHSTARTLNTSLTINNSKLMAYLLKDGPFTKEKDRTLSHSDIRFFSVDDTNGCLRNYPSNVVPIILHPDGSDRLVFGIDPVDRVVWLGDTEIFGNYKGGSGLNFDSSNGSVNAEANMMFLNNVLAWITNAAIYGEEFTSQFYE